MASGMGVRELCDDYTKTGSLPPLLRKPPWFNHQGLVLLTDPKALPLGTIITLEFYSVLLNED